MNTNRVRTLGYTSADAAGRSILAGLMSGLNSDTLLAAFAA
jgi:hypothetical protein